MMTDREQMLLTRIGSLIRGDWSGNYFDGRDVARWIQRVIEGKDLDKLDEDLTNIEVVVYT